VYKGKREVWKKGKRLKNYKPKKGKIERGESRQNKNMNRKKILKWEKGEK
jgi:hypothetical protein